MLLYGGVLLVIIGALGLSLMMFLAKDDLPAGVDDMIQKALNSDLPEYIKGDTGYANSDGVKIFYESIQPKGTSKGTLILTNGLTYTLHDWPITFVDALVDAGYHVIRYDNRDVGLSDWISGWTKETAYTLEDMALDTIAVLDHLSIAKAHIVGVSMGGMISQRVAINYPQRVLSLTSIMSSGFFYDPTLTAEPFWFKAKFGRAIFKHGKDLKEHAKRMKFHLAMCHICSGKGDYEVDNDGILLKSRYELTNRKGYNPKAQERHGAAIKGSGSRYDGLKSLNTPVLVIHGTDDPLIKFEHAKKYAGMITGVNTLFVDGMGHDLPLVHAPAIIQEMTAHFSKV